MKPTTKHNSLVAALFVAAATAIILALPREKTLYLDFAEGKPWRYEQLNTAFDFPVEKSAAMLERERAEVLAIQKPYYVKDAWGIAAVDSFKVHYRNELHMLMSASLKEKVYDRLQQIYDTGIVGSADLERLAEDSVGVIMLVNHTVAVPTMVSSLYSVQQAYESLMAIDTTRWGRYVLQSCNLNDYIRPNLTYDEAKSVAVREEALGKISPYSIVIQAGQKIIGPGEMVDEEHFQILDSYRKQLAKRIDERGVQMTLVGQVLLILVLLGLFVVYLVSCRREYLQEWNKLLFLVTQLVLFPLVALWTMDGQEMLMIIPFAMAPVVVNLFLDSRTALMVHLTIVLITSIMVPEEPYAFVLLHFTGGVAAIYALRELTDRSGIFRIALVVTLCYCIVWLGYELIVNNSFASFDRRMFVYFLFNGILLLFTYPLALLYEKLYGFTSDVTLVELSNINNKLLLTLSENAPGTFQHSMQVSNLAAAAANRIGARSLLVRTGALYHDIGKMENPVFFTENQGGTNPHACLPYERSAGIIIGHVANGLRLAEKHHLPEAIKTFIATHHGKSKAKYFYVSYKNEHPEEAVDESLFTYPGPEPNTKETAILMMADAVEAASRSLPEYTDEAISALVERVIDGQVAEGHFNNCPITFKDINDIKSVFKEKLRTIHHTRISYPEIKQ